MWDQTKQLAHKARAALIAQLAERVLGKNEVSSSNLDEGSSTVSSVISPEGNQDGQGEI